MAKATQPEARRIELSVGEGIRNRLSAEDREYVIDQLLDAKEANGTLEDFAQRVFGLTVNDADDSNGKAVLSTINSAWATMRQSVLDADADAGKKISKRAPRLRTAKGGTAGGSRKIVMDTTAAQKLADRAARLNAKK